MVRKISFHSKPPLNVSRLTSRRVTPPFSRLAINPPAGEARPTSPASLSMRHKSVLSRIVMPYWPISARTAARKTDYRDASTAPGKLDQTETAPLVEPCARYVASYCNVASEPAEKLPRMPIRCACGLYGENSLNPAAGMTERPHSMWRISATSFRELYAMDWRIRLAKIARANRREIIRSQSSRREAMRLGLLTSAGYLVAKQGLSALRRMPMTSSR